MRIPASESTAIRKDVKCKNGHEFEVWYIRTPDGVVMEAFGMPHQFLPKTVNDEAFTEGNCCFKAACETAWDMGLHI